MGQPFPNHDSWHRIQQVISDVMDVSGSTAQVVKPLVYTGRRTISIDKFGYIPHTTTDNAALTVNVGITGTLTKFGTVAVPLGALVDVYVPGLVTEAQRSVGPGVLIEVGHTQSVSNTGDGFLCLDYGVAAQDS